MYIKVNFICPPMVLLIHYYILFSHIAKPKINKYIKLQTLISNIEEVGSSWSILEILGVKKLDIKKLAIVKDN